ncbi:Ion channel [Ekhidna lutea]|uniref:Ion channel n=1 Tax=Ekhidna lutea TaxID=447679 RepID=A0A239F4V5_EKHLU|nr:potassium channel family protein [Ekhidna lutea]SNS51283.1 Ion channel [Ekhidna lutea]
MKYLLACCLLFTLMLSAYSQKEIEFKRHSYSEFLQMIQQEKDTLFEYSDAIIEFNPETDQRFKIFYKSKDSVWTKQPVDTIRIDKYVMLENVHFDHTLTMDSLNGELVNALGGVWYKCRFDGMVDMQQSVSFRIYNSAIDNHFRVITRGFKMPDPLRLELTEPRLEFRNNRVVKDFNVNSGWVEKDNRSRVNVDSNEFHIEDHKGNYAFSIWVENCFRISIADNTIWSVAPNEVEIKSAQWANIQNNRFLSYIIVDLTEFYGLERVQFTRNSFDNFMQFSLTPDLPPSAFIDWSQFKGKMISDNGFGPYISVLMLKDQAYLEANQHKKVFLQQYYDSVRIANADAFLGEMAIRGRLREHFKAKYDTEQANAVFIDLKDLETKRLAYLYGQYPTFKTYFKWKINQFLKLFVDYGTEPAKAIVFAVYVIAFFALIYLFFPNSWDSHGRTRIMDRYRFFLKYLNRNEGASEVYQEEKEKELMPFHEFREVLEREGKTAPKFFYATALPLYKWSVSGSRLSGWFLSKIDVLNGKWSEVPEKGRFFKSALVIGAFLIALLYDLFIKVLNAVMLSINTFTTLGFGEIPIKGLPRYLAIIQGFIGWFMLTIFSVSLISQLLN